MRDFSYRNEIVSSATGTTVKHTSPSKILEYKFPFTDKDELINKFCLIAKNLNKNQELFSKENLLNIELKELLLSKMTKVETEKEGI